MEHRRKQRAARRHIALAAALALLALLYTLTKDRRADVSSAQAIRDKLDYISDNTRDTREDVCALDRKLDNHAERLTRIEMKVKEHDKRIENMEAGG